MRPPDLISALVDDNYRIELQWQDNSDQAVAYPDDGLPVVLCVPEARSILLRAEAATRQ